MATYKNIYRVAGIGGFYAGLFPNIARNATVNIGEMATYDQLKEFYGKFLPDNIILHTTCGLSAGFCATIVGSPFDVVKSRCMGQPEIYPSLLQGFTKTFKQGGPKAFYAGFVPNFTRLGLWTTILFVTMEQLKRLTIHPDDLPKKNWETYLSYLTLLSIII